MSKKKPAPKPVKIPTPGEIRGIRGERTQAEVAEKVGVSQSVWSAWERGAKTPSRQSAIMLRLLEKNRL